MTEAMTQGIPTNLWSARHCPHPWAATFMVTYTSLVIQPNRTITVPHPCSAIIAATESVDVGSPHTSIDCTQVYISQISMYRVPIFLS